VLSRAWQKKYKNKEQNIKIKVRLNMIFYPIAAPALRGRFFKIIFGVLGHSADVIIHAKF